MTFCFSRQEHERLLWQQHSSQPAHQGPLLDVSGARLADGESIGALDAHYALVTIADHLGHRTWFDGPTSGCGCGFTITYDWEDDRGEDKADEAARHHLLRVAAEALVKHDNIPADAADDLLQRAEPDTTTPLRDLLTLLTNDEARPDWRHRRR